MTHSFDVDVAMLVGIQPAVVFQSLAFWIEHNEANRAELHEGSTWTFNTIESWLKLFPYLTQKQIRGCLDKLKDADLIKTGNFNATSYDRKLWYALTEKGNSIRPKRQMERPKRANGSAQDGKCTPSLSSVPGSVPVSTPIAPTAAEPSDEPENPRPAPLPTPAERIYGLYPRKQARKAALKAITAALKTVAAAVLEERVTAYAAAVEDWSPEQRQYVPHPATWFNRGSWEDDPETWKRRGGGNDDRFKASFA